jgi:hypothetical protein
LRSRGFGPQINQFGGLGHPGFPVRFAGRAVRPGTGLHQTGEMRPALVVMLLDWKPPPELGPGAGVGVGVALGADVGVGVFIGVGVIFGVGVGITVGMGVAGGDVAAETGGGVDGIVAGGGVATETGATVGVLDPPLVDVRISTVWTLVSVATSRSCSNPL